MRITMKKTIEGLNSARIIEQQNLFVDLPELRNITGLLGGKKQLIRLRHGPNQLNYVIAKTI